MTPCRPCGVAPTELLNRSLWVSINMMLRAGLLKCRVVDGGMRVGIWLLGG